MLCFCASDKSRCGDLCCNTAVFLRVALLGNNFLTFKSQMMKPETRALDLRPLSKALPETIVQTAGSIM